MVIKNIPEEGEVLVLETTDVMLIHGIRSLTR